jgi:TetR/AcrR family transcriptional regulator
VTAPPLPAPSPQDAAIARLRAMLHDLPAELAPPAPDSPPGRILAATRRLFAGAGLAGVSTRAVARLGRVNQAMIHYYFGSKDRLIDAMIAQELLQVLRDVLEGLDERAPRPDVLAHFPLRILDTLRRDPLRPSLLRLTLSTEPERLRRVIRTLGRHGLLGASRALAELIAEAQAAGEVVPVPVRSVLLFLVANAYGLVLMEPVARDVADFALDDDAQWREHRASLGTLIRGGILVQSEQGGTGHA